MTNNRKKNLGKGRERTESPTSEPVQSTSGQTSSRPSPYKVPVAKSTNHPSKKAKTDSVDTMDVDSPSEDVPPQPEPTTVLAQVQEPAASSSLNNPQQQQLISPDSSTPNPTGSLTVSPATNPESTQRVDIPNSDDNPNAMTVDPENLDTNSNHDQQNDQPEFSLNVVSARYTAWAPIPSFSALKINLGSLKNKITDHFNSLKGFITVKIRSNKETKDHILVVFNNVTSFNTAIATPIVDHINFNKIKFYDQFYYKY